MKAELCCDFKEILLECSVVFNMKGIAISVHALTASLSDSCLSKVDDTCYGCTTYRFPKLESQLGSLA